MIRIQVELGVSAESWKDGERDKAFVWSLSVMTCFGGSLPHGDL